MKSFKKFRITSFVCAALLLATLFQNCGPGFQVQSLSSLGSGNIDQGAIDQFPLSDTDWAVAQAQAKQGQPVQFVLTLAQPAQRDISFSYRTVNGSALAGDDFIAVSGNVSIPAGQDRLEITVPTLLYTENISSRSFSLEVIQKTTKVTAGLIQPLFKKMAGFKKLVSAWANAGYCGITLDNKVRCFGGIRGWENNQGIWGATDQYGSVEINGLTNIVDIVGGGARYCVINQAGRILCWGKNSGTYEQRITAQLVDFFPQVLASSFAKYDEYWSNLAGSICVVSTAGEYLCRSILNEAETSFGPVMSFAQAAQSRPGLILRADGSVELATGSTTFKVIGLENVRKLHTAKQGGENVQRSQFIIEDNQSKIRCIDVDLGYHYPPGNPNGIFDARLVSNTELNFLSGATSIAGTCAGTRAGGTALFGAQLFSYTKNTDGSFSIVPRLQGMVVKDILSNGSCVRMSDETLRCGVSKFGTSGPKVAMSQVPYDFVSLKTYKIKQVSGACLLTQDSKVRCNIQDPKPVPGIDDLEVEKIDSFSNGSVHCALLKTKNVKCWQYSSSASFNAVDVIGLTGVTDISVSNRTCAVDGSSKAICWTGLGQTADLVSVSTSLGLVKKVAVGTGATCGVSLNEKILCEIGSATTELTGLAPTDRVIYLKIMGDSEILAVLASGKVRRWQGTTESTTDLSDLTNISEIQVGSYHACAKNQSGQVWCWGENGYGQFGNGDKTFFNKPIGTPGGRILKPVLAFGGQTVEALAAGSTWTVIVPKLGSSLRGAGFLWNSPYPRDSEVMDYVP